MIKIFAFPLPHRRRYPGLKVILSFLLIAPLTRPSFKNLPFYKTLRSGPWLLNGMFPGSWVVLKSQLDLQIYFGEFCSLSKQNIGSETTQTLAPNGSSPKEVCNKLQYFLIWNSLNAPYSDPLLREGVLAGMNIPETIKPRYDPFISYLVDSFMILGDSSPLDFRILFIQIFLLGPAPSRLRVGFLKSNKLDMRLPECKKQYATVRQI